MRLGPGAIGFVLALPGAAAGLAAGYLVWGARPNWFAVRDVAKLPPSPQSDLVIYGYQLVTNTQRYIGPDVPDPAMRFAGNNLACSNCHLRAGLQPFAAPSSRLTRRFR
jgi:thiosulfate dehydrogenase